MSLNVGGNQFRPESSELSTSGTRSASLKEADQKPPLAKTSVDATKNKENRFRNSLVAVTVGNFFATLSALPEWVKDKASPQAKRKETTSPDSLQSQRNNSQESAKLQTVSTKALASSMNYEGIFELLENDIVTQAHYPDFSQEFDPEGNTILFDEDDLELDIQNSPSEDEVFATTDTQTSGTSDSELGVAPRAPNTQEYLKGKLDALEDKYPAMISFDFSMSIGAVLNQIEDNGNISISEQRQSIKEKLSKCEEFKTLLVEEPNLARDLCKAVGLNVERDFKKG